ncbi:hypothetical protein [Marinobacter nitratireducens]|uniref:hypothetical protein n=1 Tax=Marinobacter nitratireducens TaxID=1137280 RepID=UPI0013637615
MAGKSQRQIAAILCCYNSKISRELRRNRIHGYQPEMAQHSPTIRRRAAFKRHKRSQWLRDWVAERLKEHWSPERIAGFMRRMNIPVQVSHQWVYDFIHRDRLLGGHLWSFCRHWNHRGRGAQTQSEGS